MFKVTCHDPAPGSPDYFTDEREIALQRVTWLDRHVGGLKWKNQLEWNVSRGSWTHHYELHCPPDIAALFKLTFG